MIVWWQQSCIKSHCQIETTIPIEFKVDNIRWLRSIEFSFYQNDRIVFSDIIHAYNFKDGVFKWEYKLYDLSPEPLTMIYRYYSHDGSWIEKETPI